MTIENKYTDLSNEIIQDSEFVRKFALQTPLIHLPWLSTSGRQVWAKLECNQLTNSFKIRGAYNAIRKISPDAPLFTASAGNHGLAVAYVAQRLKRRCTVYVPSNASELKTRRIIALGADVRPAGKDLFEATTFARAQAVSLNGSFISPFSNIDVIKGQGSLAIELLSQSGIQFENIIIPLGGGGLLAGMSSVLRARHNVTNILAAHPKIFNRNLACAGPGALNKAAFPTIADGLAVQHGPEDFALCESIWPSVENMLEVEEKDIERAIVALLHNEGVLAEGAGAIGLAALMADRDEKKISGSTLVIVTGGNISVSALVKCVATHEANSMDAAKLGHQSIKPIGELPQRACAPVGTATHKSVETNSNPAFWEEAFLRLVKRIQKFIQDIDRHYEFLQLENLSTDVESISYTKERAIAILERANSATRRTENQRSLRSNYRVLIQEYSFLRNCLAWCSASNDQSETAMFFDPQENTDTALNYDRYGSMLLRETEANLLVSLGFEATTCDLLMTSSGQAAYTVIESFLLKHVLKAGSHISISPYIYFEALEQLERLSHIEIGRSDSWSVASLAQMISESRSAAIFIDPMANLGSMNSVDFQQLAQLIKAQDNSDKWLVIDGTMVSGGINVFEIFSERTHPEILYYESGSKYLQFGLDLQMAGVVVSSKKHSAALTTHRRNTGSVMYQTAVSKFPEYGRAAFLGRMGVLTRNAETLVTRLSDSQYLKERIEIAYPGNWQSLGWKHGGGVVSVSMKSMGLNNRACLEGFIAILIQRCRVKHVAITKGVSFGFAVTRVSAAAAMADNMPPFLRFSVGEELPENMKLLAETIVLSLYDFLKKFDN
jgi:threonine dehydratase